MPTLNVSIKNNALDVDENGNPNHIPQNSNAQTITWQLTGNAASGSFNAIDGTSNSGFSWVTQPPPSNTIFGTASLHANGNQIQISDLNNSSSAAGTWTYKLCATVNNTQYCTTATLSPRATTNNPTIVNK